MRTRDILNAHPRSSDVDLGALTACIEAALDCMQTCTTCADACLGGEQPAKMARCIRTDLDCADACAATATALSRLTEPDWGLLRAQVEACRTACRTCAEECEQHADEHEHCRICGEACRACEEACGRLLEAIPATA